jgi:sigma-B regulation protein RsbU (phosphoserine phosphatase)
MAAQFYENQQRAVLRNTLLHLLGLLLLGFIVYRAVAYLRRLQTMSAEKERIAGELRVAHDIQQSMIPKTFPGFPERDDLELYARLTPAREVGGDFYDFLIRDERLYFCVGDVTGKGVPAALLMTVMRALFRTEAGREDSEGSETATVSQHTGQAAAIVQRLNAAMCEDQSNGYFVTMFVGVLDLTTGELDYCNAGHERPILLKVKGKVQSEKFATAEDSLATALDNKRNLPVGALPDWQYEGQQVQLTAGEMLFLYTDGLNEARDTHERPLSRDRVLSLARQHSDEMPRRFVELMEQAAHDHAAGAEQSDDITLMALRWLGSNRLELQTDGSDLALLEGFVEQVAGRAHLSDYETPRLRVAVEEAVTNVISYAHATSIVLTAEVRDAVLRLTVTDDGQPFDPTTAPMADTSIPADQREEGGLGILFIRRMSDALEYRRENGRNVLTIKKNISEK